MHHIVGIDEAGRGPLAGPVAVGAVKIPLDFNKKFFQGIKDSKQLTVEERKLWFELASQARREGHIDFAVALVSEKVIDRHGISYALRLGIKRVLKRLQLDEDKCQVFLDGSLKAPVEFEHQLTVVKGDEKIPVISLASIMAKVTRDERMTKMSARYPLFDFNIHKGYGTRAHMAAIAKYGPTELHRKTFLKHLTRGAQV